MINIKPSELAMKVCRTCSHNEVCGHARAITGIAEKLGSNGSPIDFSSAGCKKADPVGENKRESTEFKINSNKPYLDAIMTALSHSVEHGATPTELFINRDTLWELEQEMLQTVPHELARTISKSSAPLSAIGTPFGILHVNVTASVKDGEFYLGGIDLDEDM